MKDLMSRLAYVMCLVKNDVEIDVLPPSSRQKVSQEQSKGPPIAQYGMHVWVTGPLGANICNSACVNTD